MNSLPIWTHSTLPAGLEVPSAVALGKAGRFVFAGTDGMGAHSLLLPSSSATPIAKGPNAPYQRSCVVRAADETDLRADIALTMAKPTYGYGSDVSAVVRKFSGTRPEPDWSYTFPFAIGNMEAARPALGVSRDGKVIVATVYRRMTNSQAIAVFTPESGTPAFYTEVLTYFEPMKSVLSADGSTLLIVSQLYTMLFDVQSRAVNLKSNMEYPYGGLALSADGAVYAKSYAYDHRIDLHHRGSGDYPKFATIPDPGYDTKPVAGGLGQCAMAALSDDGKTLVATRFRPPSSVTVLAWDVSTPTPAVLFQDSIVGNGPYWNWSRDLVASKDASVFAVGINGALDGTVPQAIAYHRAAGASTWTRVVEAHLSGSCTDLDLTADGRKLAIANMRGHVDAPLGGGEISLYKVTP